MMPRGYKGGSPKCLGKKCFLVGDYPLKDGDVKLAVLLQNRGKTWGNTLRKGVSQALCGENC